MVSYNDQTNFERLYRDNVRSVLAYVLTRTRHDNAQDVVSSTFLVAWRRLDAVPADPLPWLIGVARRVLAEQRRAESRRTALSGRIADDVRTSEAPRDEVADSLVLRTAVRHALSGLKVQDREIVTLAAWQGFNTEQLATVLGCSKPLASLKLHRARRKFAALMAAELEDPLPTERTLVRRPEEAS